MSKLFNRGGGFLKVQAWLRRQYPRRFFLLFSESVDLRHPLFLGEVSFSSQQLKDGFTGFWPEYPLDTEGKTWRVSPIFRDVHSAVSWLTKGASTWRSPFAGEVNLYASEYGSSDAHDGSIVFELAQRYGSHVYADDFPFSSSSPPRATVIFRGQSDARWDLIPRLYQVFHKPGIKYKEAIKISEVEANKSDQFTREFFRDPAILLDLPQLSRLGLPTRAAVARHYGYHSQFIDFTADVGVAAFFATLGNPPDMTVPIGSIWYLDEAHLNKRFFRLAVTRMPRFEHRLLYQTSVNKLRGLLIDAEPTGSYNWAGPSDPWDQAAKLPVVGIEPFSSQWLPSVVGTSVQFSISLYFAPGPTVPRMNAQAWCAVELNTHLGWDKGDIKRSILSHKLLERLACRVNFVHGNKQYQRQARKGFNVPALYRYEVSPRALMPELDPIEQEIKIYQQRTGLVPA